MSAGRLSYTPSLSWPRLPEVVLGQPAKRKAKSLIARRAELRSEQREPVAYYTNADECVGASERPLLLLHGMHLHAGAHELVHLFDAFRSRRLVCAPDLPGYGDSDGAREGSDYFPELYVAAIKALIERCASGDVLLARGPARIDGDVLLARGPARIDGARFAGSRDDAAGSVEASESAREQSVDVVAIGLSCEYAARAVAALPDRVHTLTLIDPTGFSSEQQQSVLERLARRGTALLPVSVLTRLGLGRFCNGGFASVLSGAAFPKEHPQTAYTRVHCPTLVLHARGRRARYGELARFVRWREHYSEAELDSTCLGNRPAASQVAAALMRFVVSDSETPRVLRAG